MVYLDWNATAPIHPDVVTAMASALERSWANPASVHGPGREARRVVETARAAVARATYKDARDVVLTSGGTEANNLALGALPARRALLLSRLEHPSVVRMAEHLASRGAKVCWLPVPSSGRIDPRDVEAALCNEPDLGMVTLALVNHETGIVQPVAEVAALARARGVLVHCDAVQGLGRVDSSALREVDLVTIAAHKLRGPKGIGALATVCGVKVPAILRGGEQERGVRPGTQDAATAAGFSAALDRAALGPVRYAAVAPLRDRLERALVDLAPTAARNGDPAVRAPHVSNLSIPGWLGPELCAALDLEGVAVSSGSACSAGTADPSPVIEAMVGRARAKSALRVSLGDGTTEREIDVAIEAFRRVLARGRESSRAT